jgi:small conductance mechanosensitive channel
MFFAAAETVAETAAETAAEAAAPLAQPEAGRNLADLVLEWLTHDGVEFATRAAVALVMLLVGWLVIRIISAAVRRTLTRGRKANSLFTTFIASVVTKVCWAILLIMVLGRLGIDIAPLVAGLGVTGFIVGFAFQESLGNLASGMMIAINEPFKVGEFVSAGGLEGVVLEVNMMATVLSTPDCKRITIPNKSVWGGPITNYTVLGRRRVDLQIGIAYGADIARALEVIREAVVSVPGVLTDPEPAVAVAGLDASAVTINVRPWSRSGDYWGVYSGTLQAVKDALRRAEIEIPYPQIVVHNAK